MTGAQQHTVNHTTNLPDPRGIAGGGTAITTGTSLPHVLPRAGLIDINADFHAVGSGQLGQLSS